MTGFTKLFGTIIASSVWDLPHSMRVVWITILALKDRDHIVRATPKALAMFSRVTEEECKAAVAEFESPDPQSRTSEHEGRRIKPIEGGWLVLNGEYYRKLLSAAERKEYNRLKQAEHRKRKKTIEHDAICAGATQAINEGFQPYMKNEKA